MLRDNPKNRKLWQELQTYIDENYTGEEPFKLEPLKKPQKEHFSLSFSLYHSFNSHYSAKEAPQEEEKLYEDDWDDSEDEDAVCACAHPIEENNISYSLEPPALGMVKENVQLQPVQSLEELLHRESKTFSEKLEELMLKKGLTSVEIYEAANIDRKLFSKLRRKDYNPSKNTVLALIVGMRLNMAEAKELLTYSGYSFAPSNKTDIIVGYFIEKEHYDIFDINDVLYSQNLKCLGNSIA